MPPKILDLRKIVDLIDVVEEQISKKVKENFRSEMEDVRVEFRSQIASMKSDMISEIVSALTGVPRHVGTKGSYEEVAKDLEVSGSIGEDKSDPVERPIGIKAGKFS